MWDIEPSPVGGDAGEHLERIGDGHRGAHSSTGGVLVDLEASPGNVEISQTVTLGATGPYTLTFEVGQADDAPAGDGSALLEVWWNGVQVGGTINPNPGTTQTITLIVDGNVGANTLTFREVGAVDSTGTYLGNIQLTDVIIIDETPGFQAGSDETGALAVFDSVRQPGVDAALAGPQFAQGTGAIVTATPDYGSDGAGNVAYELAIVDGANSGLLTSEGQAIYLFKDAEGRTVGRFDANGVGGTTATDSAAFAIHINAATGVVSIAQYVSLEHPNTSSNDEGISLSLNSLTVKVTATDRDGDTATQSLDISQRIRFEDDGPTAVADNAGAIAEDVPFVYNVVSNDNAGADQPATLSSAALASGYELAGTVSILPGGNVMFDPAPGFAGPVTINYTINDADGDNSSLDADAEGCAGLGALG